MMKPDHWPDLAGRLVPGGHILPVRVYFEDTDFTGRVYHAGYLRFLERGRTDMLRLVGIGHDELARGVYGESLAFAVRRIEIDFLKPALMDDLLEVETRPEPAAGARLIVHQAIRRDAEILIEARVTVVVISMDGRARRLPSAIRDRFAAAGL